MASRHARSVKQVLFVAAAFTAACGGAGSDLPDSDLLEDDAVSVLAAETTVGTEGALGSLAVVPARVELERAGVVQFAVLARDVSGEPVPIPVPVWSATGGTVTADGRYTAGPWDGDFAVYVQAGSLEASAIVVIER